jgi:hypothetical protein
MDRPCSRLASEHACAGQQKEHHAMPKSNTAVVTEGRNSRCSRADEVIE